MEGKKHYQEDFRQSCACAEQHSSILKIVKSDIMNKTYGTTMTFLGHRRRCEMIIDSIRSIERVDILHILIK